MSDFRKLSNPLPCPGVYTLDLYCDHESDEHRFREFPQGIVEYQTGAQARAAARRAGWKLHKDGTATCPKCVARLKREKPTP